MLGLVPSLDKALRGRGRKEGKVQVPLAPTPSDSWRSTSTCLSSEQAVKEASLWWRVGPVHVQVWAQLPVSLVDVDFFEALHLYHLQRVRRVICPDLRGAAQHAAQRRLHQIRGFTSVIPVKYKCVPSLSGDVMRRGCNTSFCHGMETLPVTNLW